MRATGDDDDNARARARAEMETLVVLAMAMVVVVAVLEYGARAPSAERCAVSYLFIFGEKLLLLLPARAPGACSARAAPRAATFVHVRNRERQRSSGSSSRRSCRRMGKGTGSSISIEYRHTHTNTHAHTEYPRPAILSGGSGFGFWRISLMVRPSVYYITARHKRSTAGVPSTTATATTVLHMPKSVCVRYCETVYDDDLGGAQREALFRSSTDAFSLQFYVE